MQRGISVVIPNYNGIELFPETLPDVFAALKDLHLPFEVIVSDDCSTDSSVAFLNQHFPQVKIISNNQNQGFSVTANNGIKSAIHELVLLLNSDVRLDAAYFTHLLNYFDAPDTFGVTGRIIGWNDDLIQDGAKYPLFHHAKIKTSLNYLLCNEEEMHGGLYTTYLSGANALFDRKKFLQLDGFNELFSPFYVEDYELSLRAWRLGWKCYYEHQAICRHKTSTTIKSKSRKSFIKMITNRNKWFLHAIHLDPGMRIIWLLQLMPEILFQSLLQKSYYIKAFKLFFENYSRVRASRKKLAAIAGGKKLLSVREVAQVIQSSVKGKKIRFFRSVA